MRTCARIAVAVGLVGALAMGCASIAGIEDLSLTGSPDASSDGSQAMGDGTTESSGSSSGSVEGGGGDASSSGVDDASSSGGGVCSPGQTQKVPCGNCGTDTQTCTASGTWQSNGCAGQGACSPSSSQVCHTYGTQTCTASCAWGTCSCASTPVCSPGTSQCAPMGLGAGGVESCDACGQWGSPQACTSGTCVGGVCAGNCMPGQQQCSGNGVQTCGMNGQWGNPVACSNQTCVGGACTGVCAPGQTNNVACGNCGTDTQTCTASGAWQSNGCNGQGVCAPGTMQACGTGGTETCSASCAWGACMQPTSDCPGNFLLCDGFESDSIDTTTKWLAPSCGQYTSMGVSSAQHHSGSYSLHVAMAGVPDTSYVSCILKTKQSSIFSSTPMYFRAWVLMTAFAGTDNEFLITAQSSANGDSASGGMGINSTGFFVSGVSNSGGFDYEHTSMTRAMSPGSWSCIELEIDTDYSANPNGLLSAWDDTSGNADPALSGTAKLQALLSTTFGVTYNGPTNPTDFYFDDIAISNTYVGCNQ